MNDTIIDRRDLSFLLFELLDIERFTQHPRYSDHSRETFEAALETAHRVGVDHFAPHNRKNDLEEPTFDGERVHIIPEVKAALRQYIEAGLLPAAKDYELGGMQLPTTVAQGCTALVKGANTATFSYVGLTIAACNLLLAHGSEEQKRLYAEPMLAGRFFGTMALTEPQAGSSLADIKTTAEPDADGTYRLSGNKIFISGGDHELSENIVHLVLGRIKGAPAGVRGISLFIVPKFLVNEDGSVGERNDVALAGLIHKMGWRGTTSTMLNFGEKGGARAYLVGEAGSGLKYMFHMMNEARIGVGMGATLLGYSGYLQSLEYARTRRQGRPVDAKDPEQKPVPLIEHADVRRMLLAQKCYVEGGLALCLYAAALVDEKATAQAPEAARDADRLLDVLTPMVKAWPSQYCLEANSLAIQVHGGYGYTREYQVEQLYRDNRLNPIHEGTNGIQSLDLLGRKVLQHEGIGLRLLLARIEQTLAQAEAQETELAAQAAQLRAAVATVQEVTDTLRPLAQAGEMKRYLANSASYLEMLGHVVVGWLWLWQALRAEQALREGGMNPDSFYRGKLAACRFFYRFELPKIEQHAQLLKSLDTLVLDVQEDWF
jgi:alkylation response protein AidB-like acyl-CoA dehydrogenase